MTGAPQIPATIAMTPAAAKLHDADAIVHPGQAAALDLTVFISCYNEALYIARTIDTVRAALAELNFSYEIIVIDDCSKDNSPAIVEDYIASHPDERIRWRSSSIAWAVSATIGFR